MTATDIVAKLFSAKGISRERVLKAQGLAMRMKVDWASVLAAMPDEQRKAVESA